MEFVTGEFEEFGRVSYKGPLAYGRQEATETSRRYVDVPKLSGCSWQGQAQNYSHYIGVQGQHIASYIVDKPIFQSCVDGVRRRGSSICQFWWVQPMNLETARAASIAGPVVVKDDKGE